MIWPREAIGTSKAQRRASKTSTYETQEKIQRREHTLELHDIFDLTSQAQLSHSR